MSSENIHRPGDEIAVGNTVIVLCDTSNRRGTRWSYIDRGTDQSCDLSFPTADEAIADARTALVSKRCRHGQRGWCVDCHDDDC